jgi:hypothetical protein
MKRHQRKMLDSLREKGFVIDDIRTGKGSHLVLRITSPTGQKAVLPVAKELGDWRAVHNWTAYIRRLCQ